MLHKPVSSCRTLVDANWGTIVNDPQYLALHIDCPASIDPTTTLVAHVQVCPAHPALHTHSQTLHQVHEAGPLRRRIQAPAPTATPSNFTSESGQQCCCSAPPYPVCCCGTNRYACCVPFQQGPCGSLCKGMVIALSVLVVLVAIGSVITCRVCCCSTPGVPHTVRAPRYTIVDIGKPSSKGLTFNRCASGHQVCVLLLD